MEEPIRVITAAGKLRNGLYLRAISLYEDRIAFEVYASRRFDAAELATLRLTDDAGTRYEMVPLEDGALDGRDSIEFKPAVPIGAAFHLTQPGWGLRSRA